MLIRKCIRRLCLRPVPPKDAEIAFALSVSAEVHNFVREVQFELLDRFGKNDGLQAPPHITVKMGFPVQVTEVGRFVEYIDAVARETAPIEISMDGFGFFEEGILFLNVGKTDRLESFRRKVLSDLSRKYGIAPGAFEDNRFRYHVTVAYGLPRKNLLDVHRELSARRREFRFVSEEIELFRYVGQRWISCRRGHLCGR